MKGGWVANANLQWNAHGNMPAKERQRVFLALPLNRLIQQGIDQFRNSNTHLQQAGFRWIPEQNLHMTIFYLGPVLLRDTASIVEQIRLVLANWINVEFMFETFSLQPPSRPRMIWAQFYRNQAFRELVYSVSDVCQYYLLERPKHHDQPIPHVTIARMKRYDGLMDLKTGVVLPRLMATKAELWLSASGPKGAVYTPLATFSLGAC